MNKYPYDEVNVESAKAIKAALKKHVLTQSWLIHRLDKDWGIKVHSVVLSDVLEGKRVMGPKMRRAIWCAERIIEAYEAYYREEG